MALTGTHLRTLDDKNRLAIPKSFRDALCPEATGTLIIAPETEQALALFSVSQFQLRASEIRAQAGNSQELRTYLRLYFSQAESVEVDKQGRIRVPDRLMSFAELRQDVALLGVNDRVEVWNRLRWEEFLSRHGQSFDQIARNF